LRRDDRWTQYQPEQKAMSNDGRTDLFVFLGASIATLIGLFVLHAWYASFIDVSYHAKFNEAGPYESVVAARQQEKAQLASGKIPIDKAISQLAERGRGGFGSITPTTSADLSAISGWIYSPGFKPVVAHPIRTPRPGAAPQNTEH
jgi:hypothetical protein